MGLVPYIVIGGEHCMAVSRNTGNRKQSRFSRRILGQLSRYDLVLAAIPLIFVLSLSTTLVLPLSLHVAIAISSVIAFGLVADALYFNPPVDSARETATAALSNGTDSDASTETPPDF